MRRPIVRFALCVAVWTLLAPVVFPKSYQASRFDVAMIVERGGDLAITETVDFRFAGGPFSYVFREIPLDESDGLDDFRGFLDGQELRIGAGERPGLELERERGAVRVVWHFPPTSDATHSFVLKYWARGGLRRDEGRDLLLWRAIPGRHDYRIESSRISVTYPETARLAEQPSANRRATVATSGRETTFQTGPLSKDNGVTLRVPFVEGDLLSAPPQWQQQAERRRTELWAALKVGFLIEIALLAVGGFLIIQLRQGHRIGLRGVGPGAVMSPPEDLRPALVGALRGSWSDWRTGLATLIDLGERDFLEIQAEPKPWWKMREFTLRRKGDSGQLSLVEQALLQLIFGSTRPHAGEVRLRKAQRYLQRHWRKFTNAVKREAQAQGFFNADRQAARRRWIGWGLALMGFAVFGTSITLLSVVPKGKFLAIVVTSAIGLGVFTLGLLVLVLGAGINTLTDDALSRKKAWDAFRQHLKNLASHETSLQPEWLAAYLSYAIVLGLGNQWAKAFKERGVHGRIAWLAGKEQFEGSDVAALVAVLSSSGAGHSSAGGAGAGGGGGSSGAG